MKRRAVLAGDSLTVATRGRWVTDEMVARCLDTLGLSTRPDDATVAWEVERVAGEGRTRQAWRPGTPLPAGALYAVCTVTGPAQ